MRIAVFTFFALLTSWANAEEASISEYKKAFQPLNSLIGPWRGTGQMKSNRRLFWVEQVDWQWKFGKKEAWLALTTEKAKFYKQGELHYLPQSKTYRLTLTTVDNQQEIYEGSLEKKRMILEQKSTKEEARRIIFTFLHSNRYLLKVEVKPKNRTRFKELYHVGVTKKDVPFASKGSTAPECVVSGGKGTIAVMHKGKTYYVCCTGCKAEFEDNPEKYIAEFEAKKKKNKK